MTVSVHLTDGQTDNYMRFGDVYCKRHDGSLDVIRVGARKPFSYATGDWTDVEGDEKHGARGLFRR